MPLAAVLQGAGPHLCPGGCKHKSIALKLKQVESFCKYVGRQPSPCSSTGSNTLPDGCAHRQLPFHCADEGAAMQSSTDVCLDSSIDDDSSQELSIPSVVAITGNAIGGGVAVRNSQ